MLPITIRSFWDPVFGWTMLNICKIHVSGLFFAGLYFHVGGDVTAAFVCHGSWFFWAGAWLCSSPCCLTGSGQKCSPRSALISHMSTAQIGNTFLAPCLLSLTERESSNSNNSVVEREGEGPGKYYTNYPITEYWESLLPLRQCTSFISSRVHPKPLSPMQL